MSAEQLQLVTEGGGEEEQAHKKEVLVTKGLTTLALWQAQGELCSTSRMQAFREGLMKQTLGSFGLPFNAVTCWIKAVLWDLQQGDTSEFADLQTLHSHLNTIDPFVTSFPLPIK